MEQIFYGGSGAKIYKNGNILIKEDNSNRINAQALKQIFFYSICKGKFLVPKVLFLEGFSVHMEFVENASELSKNSNPQRFAEVRDFFVKTLLPYSVECSLDKDIFVKKLNSIKGLPHSCIEVASDFLDSIERFNYLFGLNHGDFTTKNILFDGNKYYLIDFLNSFIESPLMDYSKLFQELIIKGDNLDKYIEAVGLREDFKNYKDFINASSLFNFLRMYPYLKNEEDREKISSIIRGKKWVIA